LTGNDFAVAKLAGATGENRRAADVGRCAQSSVGTAARVRGATAAGRGFPAFFLDARHRGRLHPLFNLRSRQSVSEPGRQHEGGHIKRGSICTPIVLAGVALLVATTSARAQFPTAKCVAAKIKCANGKATGLLGCHNKAEGKNLAVDPACLSKVDTKFSAPLKGCMEKAEAKPPCATTADAAAIEAKVDAFVLDTVTALDPGYPAPVLNKCSAGKKKCVANGVKAILGC
jgi:hypothetical protein